MDELTGTTKGALLGLLLNDWFSRLWTLQEAALAKDGVVYYGPEHFDLKVLRDFQNGYENDNRGPWAKAFQAIIAKDSDLDPDKPDRPPNQHMATVVRLRTSLTSSTERRDIAGLLNLLRRLKCTDPRDRIMAILHFLPAVYVADLVEAYRSRSTQVLYTKLAKLALKSSQHPELLYTAGMYQQRSSYVQSLESASKLPTWVSDWEYDEGLSTGFWVHNNDSTMKGDKPLYQAGGDSVADLEVVDDDKQLSTLRLRAMIFDSIEKCASAFKFPVSKSDMKQGVVTTESEYLASRQKYIEAVGQVYQNQITECIDIVYASDAAKRRCTPDPVDKCYQTLVAGLITKGQNMDVHSGTLIQASAEVIGYIFEAFRILLALTKASNPSALSQKDFMLAFAQGQQLQKRMLSKGHITVYPPWICNAADVVSMQRPALLR